MSRVAKNPIPLPAGVETTIAGRVVTVKGRHGTLMRELHPFVGVEQRGTELAVTTATGSKDARMQAGTARALLANMVQGVSSGFQKKLELVGVGYRAQVQGQTLNLTLGFSHPVHFPVPEGITIQTPSQTEILVNGIDKQLVGQVAADIRAFRPPEPYKGKGVKYSNEVIVRKETKKA
ncbi:MAG: 50S ribosomal protein L6 [Gammaproteobacteria bacterium]